MDVQTLLLEIELLHDRICSALGDPLRIAILYLLAEREMYVNEISDVLDIPQSTASRHLRVLRERNLVSADRQGTAVQYSLTDERIIYSLNLMRSILAEQIQNEAAITGSSSSSQEKTDRS